MHVPNDYHQDLPSLKPVSIILFSQKRPPFSLKMSLYLSIYLYIYISRKTQGSLRRKRKSVSGGSNCKRTLIVTSLYWAQYITSSSNRNRFSEKLKLKFYTILVFSAKIANLAICAAHTVFQNGLSVELLHLGLKIN